MFCFQTVKFCAGSVFTPFYITGRGTGKFNSSFTWHNPQAVTVEVLSLPVLFGDPSVYLIVGFSHCYSSN